jgi:hypothetical protein
MAGCSLHGKQGPGLVRAFWYNRVTTDQADRGGRPLTPGGAHMSAQGAARRAGVRRSAGRSARCGATTSAHRSRVSPVASTLKRAPATREHAPCAGGPASRTSAPQAQHGASKRRTSLREPARHALRGSATGDGHRHEHSPVQPSHVRQGRQRPLRQDSLSQSEAAAGPGRGQERAPARLTTSAPQAVPRAAPAAAAAVASSAARSGAAPRSGPARLCPPASPGGPCRSPSGPSPGASRVGRASARPECSLKGARRAAASADRPAVPTRPPPVGAAEYTCGRAAPSVCAAATSAGSCMETHRKRWPAAASITGSSAAPHAHGCCSGCSVPEAKPARLAMQCMTARGPLASSVSSGAGAAVAGDASRRTDLTVIGLPDTEARLCSTSARAMRAPTAARSRGASGKPGTLCSSRKPRSDP